ncbi:MAG: 23S rRNA (adenine(2503)-C(2))-methyltransferase RlmN, partial [Omnitrophica bacterium]|nr:23S rRNA (adenine(2503)-C(2))-methyltransferase RlmN [Candidatus Omnitrophota bacterium]
LGPIKSKLNLILYNGSSSEFKAPEKEQVDSFKEILLKAGIFFTLRKPRGQDISAACGQLRARHKLIR